MDSNKQNKIKNVKILLRAFWLCLTATIAFHIGANASKGYPMIDCGYGSKWVVPNELSGFFIFTTIVVGIILLIMFLSLGKKQTPQTNDALERLEKLGKLKAQGVLSEEEFEREKKKILNERN